MAFSYDEWKKKKKNTTGNAQTFDEFKSSRKPAVEPHEYQSVRTFESFQESKRAERWDAQAPKSEKARKADADRFAAKYTPEEVKAEKRAVSRQADADRFSGMAQANHSRTATDEKSRTTSTKAAKTEKKSENASVLSKLLDPFKTAYNDLGIGDVTNAYNPKTIINNDEVKAFTDKDNKNDTLVEKRNASLRLGLGDTLEGLGQGIGYLDRKMLGENDLLLSKGAKLLEKAGQKVNEGFEDNTYSKEFSGKSLTDPEWYATSVTRAVPNALSSIAPGLATAKVLGNVNKIAKLPTIAKTIIQSIGGAGATTAYDSAILSGGIYDEAKKRGMSEEEALDAADKAFWQNSAVTGGMTALEFGLGLTPFGKGLSQVGKVASVGARTTGGALAEGFQEGAQTGIEANALGDKFSWTDKSTIEAMIIGGILGGTMTGSLATYGAMKDADENGVATPPTNTPKEVNPVQEIMESTISDLPTDLQEQFDDAVFSLREQGIELEEAREVVLEEMVKRNPAIQETIVKKSQEFKENKQLEQQSKANNPVTQMEKQSKAAVQQQQETAKAQDFIKQLEQINKINETVANQDGTLNTKALGEAQQEINTPNSFENAPQQAEVISETIPQPIQQEAPKELKSIKNESLEVATGDKVNLQGTRASTVYEVQESTPTEAKVKTPNGKTITIPKNRIAQIVERANEPSFGDEVQDTVVKDLPQPEQVGEVQLPPNFRNDVKAFVSEVMEEQNLSVDEAVALVKEDDYYKDNPEWSKIIEEEAVKHFGYKSKVEENNAPKQAKNDVSEVKEKTETKVQEEPKSEEKHWKKGQSIHLKTGNQPGVIEKVDNGRALIKTESGKVVVPVSELMDKPAEKEKLLADVKKGDLVRDKRPGFGKDPMEVVDASNDKFLMVNLVPGRPPVQYSRNFLEKYIPKEKANKETPKSEEKKPDEPTSKKEPETKPELKPETPSQDYKVGETVERRVKRSNGWGWMEDTILEVDEDQYEKGRHHITFQHIGLPSDLVRKVDKKETKVESKEESTPVGTTERMKQFNKKFREGDYTAKYLQDHFQFIKNNEEEVKAHFMDMMNNSEQHKRKRKDTKIKYIDNLYKEALERPAYGDTNMLTIRGGDIFASPESQEKSRMKQLEDTVNKITDESIAEHLSKRKAEQDEKQRMKDNPESVKDYIYKRDTVGLTSEEQAKLDELVALKQKEKQAEVKAPSSEVISKGEYTITPDKDSRDNSDIWIVKPKEKLDKAEYMETVKSMKKLGGYYSRFKKGFLFKEDPTAKLEGDISEEIITPGGRDAKRIAERLRGTAENMQKTIDDKRNDNRLTNTHKRATQDAYAREEADRLEIQQGIMKRVADAIESGEATFLDNVTARTHIETLQRIVGDIKRSRWQGERMNPNEIEKVAKQPITEEEINNLEMPKVNVYADNLQYVTRALTGTKGLGRSIAKLEKEIQKAKGNSNHLINAEPIREDLMKVVDAAIKLDKEKWHAESIKERFNVIKRLEAMNLNTVPLLRSGIREFIRYTEDVGENTEQKQKDARRKKEAELSKLNIPGFFPTPSKIISRMVEEADIESGMTVLEPSAGKGNIAAAIKDIEGVNLDVVEYNFTLADYLKSEGYNVVGNDFLEFEGEYDRILMNPPFENLQDVDHVKHAFEMLNPGGRLVAIMSESPFFNSNKKATEFREWLEENDGVSEQLEKGSFKDSERTTGVATRIVTIDKPKVINDRDSYTIERVGQEPFVVKRGDEVQFFISKNNFKKDIVTSISHAKKEINGFPYGSVYPLNYKNNESVEVKKEFSKSTMQVKSLVGNDGKAFTENGTEIEFVYSIVEINDLIVSNDTDGSINPDYPQELQPRDRSRKSSQMQVQKIAQQLNPVLLGESPKASDGAPIVGPDMVVESGNGRTMALTKMYKEGYDSSVDYGEYITEVADNLGLNKKQLETFKNPVLVRVRTNEVDRKKFVSEANESNVSAMSTTEQATVDADKMNNKLMTLFVPGENGDLNVASNRAFISAFMGDVVAANERAKYMTKDGNLSQEGLIRVRNAVFSKAYGGNEAISLLAESTDNNVRNITNAMLQTAPRFALMKDAIKEGSLYNEDITQDIVEAMVKLAELRSEGTSVETFLQQISMFDDLSPEAKEMLNIFDDKTFKRSAKALAELFNQYVNVLEVAGNPKQIKLFDDVPPTKADILTVALKRVKQDENGEVQTSLFETEGENSNEAGATTSQKRKGNNETFVGTRRKVEEKNFQPKAEPENQDNTVTRSDIIKHIQKNFKVAVGVGKTRKPKGLYKNKRAVIRSKEFGDFEVIAHELGHHFDFHLGLSTNPKIREELIKFAKANLEIPDSMPKSRIAKEGVAEYFRQLFYNDQAVNLDLGELSETLHQTITEGLAKKGWTNSVVELREKTNSWLHRDAEQELAGIVTPIGNRQKKRSVKRYLMDVYTELFEKEHPIWVAERLIEKELKQKNLTLPTEAKAYVMSVMTRGTVARAVQFTKFATFKTDFNRMNNEFEITGESLEDILKDIPNPEQFGQYLVAKHGYYLKTKKGKKNTPISEELIKNYLDNESSENKALAQRIYDYQHRLLDVLVDGGLIDKDLPAKLKKEYPFYVPFYRDMSETGDSSNPFGDGSSGFANQQQGIKKMSEQGSSRNIINPIESIVKNTHLYFALADRNSVGMAMASWADPENDFATEIARDLIEEIPNKFQVTNVALEQLHKTLLNAGLEEEMLDGVNMEETTKIFTPIFKPSSSENEVLVWIDGKPKLYKVRDNSLYKALVNHDNQFFTKLMDFSLFKLGATSNKVLRWGITASPFFTVRTFIRSLFQMLIKTNAKGVNYFLQVPMIGKAMWDVGRKNNNFQEWLASGSGQSTMIAIERNYLDKSLDKIALNQKTKNMLKMKYQPESTKDLFKIMTYMGKNIAASPFVALQNFNDTLDQALKLSEYKVVKKQTKGDIQKSARASRDADLDYARMGGTGMKFMNSLTLFFNISFQGVDNVAREWSKHKVRTTMRGLIGVTLPTILLFMKNYDDEDYWELNTYERDLNWTFKQEDGTFVKIPIPFELGILFKTIPEKLWGDFMDFSTGQDKQSWKDFYKNIGTTLAPSLTPTIYDVTNTYKTKLNQMDDRSLIPMYLEGKKPEDQYTENTSEVAKWLGKKLKKSPIIIEATFNAQFAQMGQAGLYFTDKVMESVGLAERPDTEGLKRNYVERYLAASIDDGSTASTTTFYEKLKKLEAEHKSNGISGDPTDELVTYRRASDDLRDLRKVRDGLLYDKLLMPDGSKFSKAEKKRRIDIANAGIRDIARYVQGKEPLDQEALIEALELIKGYTDYEKAVNKQRRQEKKIREQQKAATQQ